MKNVFVTAYDSFSNYELLKRIYDKIFSNIPKDDLCFYCTVGSSGDNTCAKYIRENEMQMIDWLNPRKGKTIKEERKRILTDCDYAVVFMDGYHKGMITATDQARKYIKKQLIIVSTNLKEIAKFDKKLNSEQIYEYDDNRIYKKKESS